MLEQSKYEKVWQHYNILKHQWVDHEADTIEMYNKVSGIELFNKEDRAYLEAKRRPVIAYNFNLPILLYLTGSQRQSRSYMRAIPTTPISDEATARLMTQLMYWNFNKTWYEYENSKAFMHSLIAGLGWKHDWWDYLEGHWILRSHDGLRIRFDINTQSSRLLDCRFLQDFQWQTKEEAFSMVGDNETLQEVKYRFKKLEPMGAISFLDKAQASGWTWAHTPKQGEFDYIDTKEGRYKLIDHHEQVDVPEVALIDLRDPDVYEVVTDAPTEKIQSLFSQNPYFRRYEFVKKEHRHTVICPAIEYVLVDEPYPIQTGMFAWKPTVCYDIVPELKSATSVFSNLKDIVDSINKRRSTTLEYIMKTVGGDWIYSNKAVAGYEHLWENNEMGVNKIYNAGQDRPVRDFPLQINQGLTEYEQEDINYLEWISAVGRNARGFKESANESGVVVGRKLQQTEVMFTLLFDNAEMSQRMDAKSCIKHIQQAMTTARAVRVLNEKQEPEWLNINWETLNGILNDVTVGEYDIEIDTSKPSITAQQLAFIQASELLKFMPPEMQGLSMDFVVETSDVPQKNLWAKRIKSLMQKTYGFDPDNPEQLYNNNPNTLQGQPTMTQELQNTQFSPDASMLARAGVG